MGGETVTALSLSRRVSLAFICLPSFLNFLFYHLLCHLNTQGGFILLIRIPSHRYDLHVSRHMPYSGTIFYFFCFYLVFLHTRSDTGISFPRSTKIKFLTTAILSHISGEQRLRHVLLYIY